MDFKAVTSHAHASVNLMAGWAWWITGLTILILLWYAVGTIRRRRRGHPEPWAKQLLFYTGVLICHFSIEPPLDVLEDHLFSAHMLQHMVLRLVGPMLVTLAAPLAVLIAGMPRLLRTYVFRPLVRAKPLQVLWGFLVHPFWSAFIWMATFCIWQWPPFFDTTILSERMDDFQHVTLLITGLFFWWMAFDPRGKPGAVRYGARVLAILGTLLPNIALGAYITLIPKDLYPAYLLNGRIWGVWPALDQQIGGLIIWIPGSMMTVIGALIVFVRWLREESERPLSYQAKRRLAAMNRKE